MAHICQRVNDRWQAIVNRHDRRPYAATFATRKVAEDWSSTAERLLRLKLEPAPATWWESAIKPILTLSDEPDRYKKVKIPKHKRARHKLENRDSASIALAELLTAYNEEVIPTLKSKRYGSVVARIKKNMGYLAIDGPG